MRACVRVRGSNNGFCMTINIQTDRQRAVTCARKKIQETVARSKCLPAITRHKK